MDYKLLLLFIAIILLFLYISRENSKKVKEGFALPCDTGFFVVGDEMRRYTKKQCDSIGGNYYPNGECINPAGGSYSWNCRRAATFAFADNIPEVTSLQSYKDGNNTIVAPPSCQTGVFVTGENIRRYTKEQCVSIGGNYNANGECLKQEGGSHSWDCRREAGFNDGIKEINDFALYNTSVEEENNRPNPCQMGVFHSDKEMRVYTKKECNLLNGQFYPSGECLKQGGGSHSWNCRKEVSGGMNVPIIANETNELDNNQPNDEAGEQEPVEEQEELQEEKQKEQTQEESVPEEESEEEEQVQIEVENDDGEPEVVALDNEKPLVEQIEKNEEPKTTSVKSKPTNNESSLPSFLSILSILLICCCSVIVIYFLTSGSNDDVVDEEFDNMKEELLEGE